MSRQNALSAHASARRTLGTGRRSTASGTRLRAANGRQVCLLDLPVGEPRWLNSGWMPPDGRPPYGLSADQAHASCRPPEATVAVPPVDRAAPTAVQPRRSPRMLMATRPSPQPSWTTHQGPTWAWWPDAGQATVETTSRPDADSEAARLQRRRSQKPANAPTTAVSKIVPRALSNHGSTASGLAGGGSTAIPIPRSTTQATAPMVAQRPLIGPSSQSQGDER